YPPPACPPPPTAAKPSCPPAHEPSRSNPAAACAALRHTQSQAAQSKPPAAQPQPPKAEQTDRQAPQCSPHQKRPLDSPAATAAALPARPSGSRDSASHRARSPEQAEHSRHSSVGCYHRPGSSQTPPTCRTAPPIQPTAGSRKARDVGRPSASTGCPVLA